MNRVGIGFHEKLENITADPKSRKKLRSKDKEFAKSCEHFMALEGESLGTKGPSAATQRDAFTLHPSRVRCDESPLRHELPGSELRAAIDSVQANRSRGNHASD
jgi:hypothetical protein